VGRGLVEFVPCPAGARRGWVRPTRKSASVARCPLLTISKTLEKNGNAYLFRTVDWNAGELTQRRMFQADAYRMIRWRAHVAGSGTTIGHHTFRVTGARREWLVAD
jgi:hypothetical protein